MATVHVYNTTDSPVVIDNQGHQLDGRSWADLERDDEVLSPLIAAGVLLVADTTPSPPRPAPKTVRQTASEE